MKPPAIPDFDLVHRTERVTNISPASDAFVLFTLATLFFTIGCFALWMWFIWRRSRRTQGMKDGEDSVEILIHEPVSPSSEQTATEAEEKAAPWEKPADWWKE